MNISSFRFTYFYLKFSDETVLSNIDEIARRALDLAAYGVSTLHRGVRQTLVLLSANE